MTQTPAADIVERPRFSLKDMRDQLYRLNRAGGLGYKAHETLEAAIATIDAAQIEIDENRGRMADLQRKFDGAVTALETEANWIDWEGNEDRQHMARLKVCQERREQWGDDDCDEKDGSCAECSYDMAEVLEINCSARKRGRLFAVLASIRGETD